MQPAIISTTAFKDAGSTDTTKLNCVNCSNMSQMTFAVSNMSWMAFANNVFSDTPKNALYVENILRCLSAQINKKRDVIVSVAGLPCPVSKAQVATLCELPLLSFK